MIYLLFAALVCAGPWRQPPPEVLEVLDAPELPNTSVSPDGAWLLVTTPVRYPPIADRAAPMHKLAGMRVDPRTGGFHTPNVAVDPRLVSVRDGREVPIRLPEGVRVLETDWSADTERLAIVGLRGEQIGLYLTGLDGSVTAVDALTLAPLLGPPVSWLPDQDRLLVRRADGRGAPPPAPAAPDGPETRSSGGASASSTYEARDLLVTGYDDALFSHFAASTLAIVDARTGAVTDVGPRGVYGDVQVSPDGRWWLVEVLVPPWSHRVTWGKFAHRLELWSPDGEVVQVLAELPAAEQVPIHGVPEGPRAVRWDPTANATLQWVEAVDGGDPRKEAAIRDRLVRLEAPFGGAPTPWLDAPHRVQAWWALPRGGALVQMDEWERRWRHLWVVDKKGARPWYDGSSNDRYGDPGYPIQEQRPDGRVVLLQDGDGLFFVGEGASPTGDRPFLDRRSLATGTALRLFRSAEESYESFVAFDDPKRRSFLIRRQSETLVPNLHEVTLGARVAAAPGEATLAHTDRPVTAFTDPTPQLQGITRQIVTYARNDGVPLSFTLYLPPGYQPGTPLPTVLYAYPREFSDPGTAGQVSGSTHTFARFGGPTHLFFLLRGYAVLHNTTMPVLGDPETAYDTFVPQLVADAEAAIAKAVELGVTDPERVGVIGHSHGGLMTATLIAHSDLFRAGIARSGSYNHTIRPFGWQSEMRTLWEAKDSYLANSPVLFAPAFDEPLLIIHGAIDENPGTIPFQSERLFEAIRGVGGTARLVMLPFEGHGYQARESVEHVLAEQIDWFDTWVKAAPPRPTP